MFSGNTYRTLLWEIITIHSFLWYTYIRDLQYISFMNRYADPISMYIIIFMKYSALLSFHLTSTSTDKHKCIQPRTSIHIYQHTHIAVKHYRPFTLLVCWGIFTNCCNSLYCRLHDFNLCYCFLAAATYKTTSCTYSRTLINGWSALSLIREWNTQPAYQQQANDRDQTNMAHFSLAVKKAILGTAAIISPYKNVPWQP